MERFQQWLDPDSSITRSKLLNLQAGYKTDAEEIKETVENIDDDVTRVKGRVRIFFFETLLVLNINLFFFIPQMRTMDQKLSKIEQMMELLVKHQGVDISEINETD